MSAGRLRTALVVIGVLAVAAGTAHAQEGGSIYDRFPLDPADRAAPAAPVRPATPAPETPSPAPATPVRRATTVTSEDGGMTIVLIAGGVLLGALIITMLAVEARNTRAPRMPAPHPEALARPETVARPAPAPRAVPTPAPGPTPGPASAAARRSPHAVPYPDHPVAAPPPRWKPKGHASPYPDHPVAAPPPRAVRTPAPPPPEVPAPAGPGVIRATDLPHPVAGSQPEEEPFVPVRRFERRAERARDVPYPAGPRRRGVAPPSPDGGTAVATRPVATAVTAPAPPAPPPARPAPVPEAPVRGPYGTARIPTGEIIGGLAADAARAAAVAAATALTRASEARQAIGRALNRARRRDPER